ncbi:MAG: L-rhamnose mutarotase [Bacteroidales bacterium]|nr:L-rhamnose mutarotase [Bacteroidales bacterium]
MKTRHLLKGFSIILILAGIYAFITSCSGNPQKNSINSVVDLNYEAKRIGMVIKIDSSRLKEYFSLHADSNPGVRDLLSKYHMKNFSIFITQLEDGNYYEFGYYEYTGSNYEKDMAALDAEPRNKEWLRRCDPLQIPLKGETSWKKMEQIYFNK